MSGVSKSMSEIYPKVCQRVMKLMKEDKRNKNISRKKVKQWQVWLLATLSAVFLEYEKLKNRVKSNYCHTFHTLKRKTKTKINSYKIKIKGGLKKNMASMSINFNVRFGSNEKKSKSEKKEKIIRPKGVTIFGLKKIIMSTIKVNYLAENKLDLYLDMNGLASTIYDEFYLEYSYEEFMQHFKDEFKYIFLKNELDHLEVL
ncbi:MAG: hypothetical protein CMF23_07940 [Ignavibacteriae bacterium]|nr:hypothetical protein [Ignavibacteriota bacterium]